MADPPSIFDDFTDAPRMLHTVCEQVSAKEYEENISCETDKALGDLCMYLDQHPEIYARILRKRKQDEMEDAGLVSFVKSKMMKLVHGDDYPESLVSISECIQQTHALKAGLCKTFQYAQEVKGAPNRYSNRLAAKRNLQKQRDKSRQDRSASKSHSMNKVGSSALSHADGSGKGDSQSHETKPSVKTAATFISTPLLTDATSTAASCNGSSLKEEEGANEGSGKSIKDKAPRCEAMKASCPGEGSDKAMKKEKSSPSLPLPLSPPPPAPPLPATVNSTPSSRKMGRRSLSSLSVNTKADCRVLRRSPRVGRSGENSLAAREGDKVPTSPHMDSPLATPMVARKRPVRKSQSSSSVNSVDSVRSLRMIHSEILGSNPISRLKVTQIIRSPGGTPVRPGILDRTPSEPLHKALLSAMKKKFDNVYTPSPRSGNVSMNDSTNSNGSCV